MTDCLWPERARHIKNLKVRKQSFLAPVNDRWPNRPLTGSGTLPNDANDF